MKKYWIDALFTKNDIILTGEIGTDGLLIKLPYLTVRKLLLNYPTNKDNSEWYFNDTKDRLIAEELSVNTITANPQLMWQEGFEIHT